MRGLGAQAEPAVGVAHGVGEARAAGHDEQPMAPTELAEGGAEARQRVVADTAADLDDGQHRRAASSAASAAAGPPGPAATARPMREATSRPMNAPEPAATTGASGSPTRRAASSI